MDLTAPSAGFRPPFPDEFFETLQIPFNTHGHDAEGVADLSPLRLRLIGN